MSAQPLRVGIGGPVGSGKTALLLALCRALRDRYEIAVVTNDIYTEEDAAFLVRNEALPAERIIGVETGGCPHTAIREDASINLEAVDRLARRFGNLDVIFVESGGDNLAATFSPELSDLTLYVIDVAAGDKIPRKGGPGITRSDLLIINKIDLAPMVGASLEVMDRDAQENARRAAVRVHQPQDRARAAAVIAFIEERGMLVAGNAQCPMAFRTYASADREVRLSRDVRRHAARGRVAAHPVRPRRASRLSRAAVRRRRGRRRAARWATWDFSCWAATTARDCWRAIRDTRPRPTACAA